MFNYLKDFVLGKSPEKDDEPSGARQERKRNAVESELLDERKDLKRSTTSSPKWVEQENQPRENGGHEARIRTNSPGNRKMNTKEDLEKRLLELQTMNGPEAREMAQRIRQKLFEKIQESSAFDDEEEEEESEEEEEGDSESESVDEIDQPKFSSSSSPAPPRYETLNQNRKRQFEMEDEYYPSSKRPYYGSEHSFRHSSFSHSPGYGYRTPQREFYGESQMPYMWPPSQSTPQRIPFAQQQTDVARKVLSTLGKMTTPLEEVRNRRPPSWPTPSLLTASRSPHVQRMGTMQQQYRKDEPTMPRQSLQTPVAVNKNAYDEPKSITQPRLINYQRNQSPHRQSEPLIQHQQQPHHIAEDMGSSNGEPNKKLSSSLFSGKADIDEGILTPPQSPAQLPTRAQSPPRPSFVKSSLFDTKSKPSIPPNPDEQQQSSGFSVGSEKVNQRFIFTPPSGVSVSSAVEAKVLAVLGSEKAKFSFTTFNDIPLPQASRESQISDKITNQNISNSVRASAVEPEQTPVQSDLFKKFALPKDMWKCEVCLVKNKNEWDKCASCETAKPAATATSIAPVATSSSIVSSSVQPAVEEGSSSIFAKFALPKDMWKCEVCLVKNKLEWDKCASCENPRPVSVGATPAPTSSPALESNPTESKKKKVQFSFGPTADSSKGSETKAAPALDFSKSSSSGFQFGAAPSGGASEDKPAFSFGSSTTSQPATAPFTFGKTPSEPEKKDENQTKKPAPFSFGAPSSTNTPVTGGLKLGSSSGSAFSFGDKKEKEVSTAQAPATEKVDEASAKQPFVFGASTPSTSTSPFGGAKTEPADPSTAPTSSFNFGAVPSSQESKQTAPSSSFTFGAAKPAEEKEKDSTTKEPSGGFSFGQSSSDKPSGSSSVGLFGGSSTSTSKTETKSDNSSGAGGFTFGGSGSSTKPAETSSSLFSFGKTDSTKKEEENQKPSTSSGFTFGGSAPSNTGPSFGSNSETKKEETPSTTTKSQSSDFVFGAKPADSTTAKPAFGSSSTPPSFTSGSSGGFAFGTGSSSAPTSGSSFGFGNNTAQSQTSAPSTENKSGTSSSVAAPFQFGKPASQTPGSSSTPGGGFTFGGQSPQQSQTSAFGSNSSSSFGSSTQVQSTNQFSFGNSSSTTSNGSKPLGSSQPQPASTGFGGGFGSGSTSFGGNLVSTAPAFGAQSNNNNSLASPGFGVASNSNSMPTFGGAPNSNAGASAFGGMNNSTTSFGSASSNNSMPSFGGSSGSSGFGGGNQFGGNMNNNNNGPFGGGGQSNPGGFGSNNTGGSSFGGSNGQPGGFGQASGGNPFGAPQMSFGAGNTQQGGNPFGGSGTGNNNPFGGTTAGMGMGGGFSVGASVPNAQRKARKPMRAKRSGAQKR